MIITDGTEGKPDSNIIDIRGEPLEIIAADKEHRTCLSSCRKVLVDFEDRTVECRECGRILDPFDYLKGWALEGKGRMQRLKSLDDEIRLKHNELEIIKTALAREKAKVRKINPDAPEVITWRRQMAKRNGKIQL